MTRIVYRPRDVVEITTLRIISENMLTTDNSFSIHDFMFNSNSKQNCTKLRKSYANCNFLYLRRDENYVFRHNEMQIGLRLHSSNIAPQLQKHRKSPV